MPEETVVRYCSPTIAGLKTASLFTNPVTDKQRIQQEVIELNRKLNGSHLCACIIGYTHTAALIYVFDPKKLCQDLLDEKARALLKAKGYDVTNIGSCIQTLKARLQQGYEEFPHEIGLFLGYPTEDVEGFISHKPCKYIGMWKVYGDVERAQKIFELYEACRQKYEDLLSQGISLKELVHIA